MANGKSPMDRLAEMAADVEAFDQTPEGWDQDLRLDLVEIVIRHLADSGMTRTQLAAKAGMKPPQLTRILQASQNVTSSVMTRILHAVLYDAGSKFKLMEVPADRNHFIYPNSYEDKTNGKEIQKCSAKSNYLGRPIQGTIASASAPLIGIEQPNYRPIQVAISTQPIVASSVG